MIYVNNLFTSSLGDFHNGESHFTLQLFDPHTFYLGTCLLAGSQIIFGNFKTVLMSIDTYIMQNEY